MAGKREAKRAALRERLIEAAWHRIAADGLAGLTARELAAEAGCALGSLYTAFDDLDDIAMHANLRTLERLGASLVAAAEGRRGAAALQALALAYARFATEHRRLWEALFDPRAGGPPPAPDWFADAHTGLLTLISSALREIPGSADAADPETRARTCFAAVHGIVSISLEGRFVGHPADRLEQEVGAFVDLLALGLAAEAAGAPGDRA